MQTIVLCDEAGRPIRRGDGSESHLVRVFPLRCGETLKASLLPRGEVRSFVIAAVVEHAAGCTAIAKRVPGARPPGLRPGEVIELRSVRSDAALGDEHDLGGES